MNYFNSSTTITLHAKRYTKGELIGTWRPYLKITHRATIDGREHIKFDYRYAPDYMGHLTRKDALETAKKMKENLL